MGLSFIPFIKISKTVFVTNVAIIPQAIAAPNALVIPTYIPAFSPNASVTYAYPAPFFLTYFAAVANTVAKIIANTAAIKYDIGAYVPATFITPPGVKNIPVPIIEFIPYKTILQNPSFLTKFAINSPFSFLFIFYFQLMP